MIFEFLTQRRRRNVRARPFPSAWKSIIARNVPSFRRLPPADQKELPLFSDRSPEVAAMTAHFHASAYGERKNASGANLDYPRGDAASVIARTFLNLGQEDDSRAE
jgi:hypothetical protein